MRIVIQDLTINVEGSLKVHFTFDVDAPEKTLFFDNDYLWGKWGGGRGLTIGIKS